MPSLARAFVKASFAYLILAFVLGALVMLNAWLNFSRWLALVYLSQFHLLVVGWITQLALGVAYWIFPRFLKSQSQQPRGSESLAWAVVLTLNAGLLLRFAAEPFYLMGTRWLGGLVALSGVLQAAAVLGFVWLIWGRIRSMEP